METTKRIAAKAITWQLSGLIAMSAIGYIITGSLESASGFAVFSALLGTVFFFVHEKIWSRITWGRSEVAGLQRQAPEGQGIVAFNQAAQTR